MTSARLVLLITVGTVATIGVSSAVGHSEPVITPGVVTSSGDDRVHRTIAVDGATWKLRSFHDTAGRRCIAQDIAESDVSIACLAEVPQDVPVMAFPGARQSSSLVPKRQWDQVWVRGIVLSEVERLEVVNTDCSVVAVPFGDSGAFMHVTSRDDILRGVSPYRLIARDNAGKPIWNQIVLVGLPQNGKAAGLDEPSAAPECR
jgi:hypothetical protein